MINIDWEDLLLNHTNNLQSNILYIRSDEQELYKDHIKDFKVEYLT